MGYRRKPKTYNIAFAEDHELHGLEVTMRGLPLGEFLRLQAMDFGDMKDAPELLQIMASRMVRWNLEEEDGTPVPATLESLEQQDLELVVALMSGWVDAIAGVPAPLEQTSPGGQPSPEVSIPMDVLSANLLSSHALSSSSGSAVPSTFSPAPS